MTGEALAITRSGLTAGGAVITAGGIGPAAAFGFMLGENLRGKGQVQVGIEDVARMGEALALPANIELAQACVDIGCAFTGWRDAICMSPSRI